MSLFVPQAKLLGVSAALGAAAADTPVVAWEGDYGLIVVQYFIAGYANTSIALLRLGLAAAEDTGANYSSFTNDFSTTATTGTSRVSQTGVHVANATTTNARRGEAIICNLNGAAKKVTINGRTYSAANPTAATASANGNKTEGGWFNNGVVHCARLNGGGQNLSAGTFIAVYGAAPGSN